MLRGYTFLLVPLLLGYLLSRASFVPRATAPVLNFFVINIALPATVLLSIRNIALSYDLLTPVATQWGLLVIAGLLILLVSHLFKFDRLVTGTMLLVVPLGNTAFLGLSVIPVFFGREAIPYGVIYDQLGSFLALATYGAAVANTYGKGNGTDLGKLSIRVLTFPPLIFLIAGFFLRDFSIPGILNDFLKIVSWTLVPAAMLAIGLNISLKIERRLLGPLVSSLVIKLILMPVVTLLVFLALGLTGLAAEVSIFQAAMPSMITAAVLASDKGLEKRLATSIVSIGLVLSLATLPLVSYLIEIFIINAN